MRILKFSVGLLIALSFAIWLFLRAMSPSASLALIQNEVRREFPTVAQKSTGELAVEQLDSTHPAPVLLDVRSVEEFNVSHLKGARLIDPHAEPESALAGIDKDAEIVVYCSVGYRSSDYAQKLIAKSYTHVFNLDGSIFKWANEGRPIYVDSHEADFVHPYSSAWSRLLKPRYRFDLNAIKK